MYKRFVLWLSWPLLLLISGCLGSEDPVFEQPRLNEVTFRNLHAPDNPGTWDLNTGVFTSTGYQPWVFFNLKSGQIVDRADSNTTLWDIAFKGPRIYVNSGISGPGDAAAVVLETSFEQLSVVPEDNAFRQDQPGGDGSLSISAVANSTIPNPLGWRSERSIPNSPSWARMTLALANRTIALRLTNGWFAKLQVLSYHQGSPSIDQITYNVNDRTLTDPRGEYYTFRWVVQSNGRGLQ